MFGVGAGRNLVRLVVFGKFLCLSLVFLCFGILVVLFLILACSGLEFANLWFSNLRFCVVCVVFGVFWTKSWCLGLV